MNQITQKRLKEVFEYVDGYFVCKIQRSILQVGDIVGTQRKDGYVEICVDKKIYLAHRLVFMFFNGYFPKEIDHINNIRNDNRIENLREVTHTQNQWNHALRKNNTSGYKGVCFNKKNNKWRAQIRHDSKKIYLGMFETPQEAYEAYCNAAITFRKEFARLD